MTAPADGELDLSTLNGRSFDRPQGDEANRYAVCGASRWRETRSRRIARLVEMLARGETIRASKPRARA